MAASAPGPPLPLRVPRLAALADDSAGRRVRRGRALLLRMHDSLPAQAPTATLRCQGCHLDDGTRPGAAPWVGVAARYPQPRPRAGRPVTLAERVNECIGRSLGGRPLPPASREMGDVLAYLAWLSAGYPPGSRVAGQGMAPLDHQPARPPDPARGALVYAASCARCHGADGAGVERGGERGGEGGGNGAGAPPALWGPHAATVGAGMVRVRTAAGFVRHHMPHDRPGTLPAADAWDVAGFLATRPRRDYPAKHADWPRGDVPIDAPYRTDAAPTAPRLLPPAPLLPAAPGGSSPSAPLSRP